MPPHHRGFIRSLGHSLKSLLMGFIFSLEDKSNEWSTEDKLNVLSTKDKLNKGEQVERDGEHPLRVSFRFVPTVYLLQHKHKQRRCEATFGKRQHVAASQLIRCSVWATHYVEREIRCLNRSAREAQREQRSVTRRRQHCTTVQMLFKLPLGDQICIDCEQRSVTRWYSSSLWAVMRNTLWATNYVLIATPTICLSLFECDA